MNIVYACNDYYIPQTGISMISLCENNKEVDEIVFYFVSDNVSGENLQKLSSIAKSYHRDFVVVPFEKIAYDLLISDIGRHNATIYAKVFFSRIDNLDKVIYLDSDIIITGSLQELWNTDLTDCYLGAVQTLVKHNLSMGLPKDHKFFNDGMAIVNVDYCRANDLIGKVQAVINKYNGAPPVLSEGALNIVCQNHVKYIHPKWNLMAGLLYFCLLDVTALSKSLTAYTKEELQYASIHPVCIHYLTAFYNRPWFKPCFHPYKDIFYKYQDKSVWKDKDPINKPLPIRIRLIDYCYRIMGYNIVEKIRFIINSFLETR